MAFTYIYQAKDMAADVGTAIGVAPTATSLVPSPQWYIEFDDELSPSQKADLDSFMDGKGYEFVNEESPP